MTYQETLKRIHSYMRFGSKLGLERMTELLRRLGDPQKDLPVIHVAGTNGKGSVCRYLYSVLEQAGYRVGLYTSPYLVSFTERIEFHGAQISESELAEAAEPVFRQADAMVSEGLESPTEFEIVTAIAFCYYRVKSPDLVILEVGLGGRGDSTNVVKKPLVSVITTISYDHMNVLGDTLEKIAREKGGIIKDGKPVVCGAAEPAKSVLRTMAQEQGCPFYDAEERSITHLSTTLAGSRFLLNGAGASREISLRMIGGHQEENARVACIVIEILQNRGIIEVSEDAFLRGMALAVQPGRLQVLETSPLVLVDGAHNVAGAEALERVLDEDLPGGKTLLVLGMLADKEVDKMLDTFLRIRGDVCATEPDNPRKLPSAELCRRIRENGRACRDLGSGQQAQRFVSERKREYDRVVVAGSLYLIGAFME